MHDALRSLSLPPKIPKIIPKNNFQCIFKAEQLHFLEELVRVPT